MKSNEILESWENRTVNSNNKASQIAYRFFTRPNSHPLRAMSLEWTGELLNNHKLSLLLIGLFYCTNCKYAIICFCKIKSNNNNTNPIMTSMTEWVNSKAKKEYLILHYLSCKRNCRQNKVMCSLFTLIIWVLPIHLVFNCFILHFCFLKCPLSIYRQCHDVFVVVSVFFLPQALFVIYLRYVP